MDNFTQSIETFTLATGQSTDHYNVKQIGLYIGLQLEEMAEMLEAVELNALASTLHSASARFKSGEFNHLIVTADREAVLDAAIALACVSIGAAHSTGANVSGAMAEIARSNLAKLVPCQLCEGVGTVDGQVDTMFCTVCQGSGKVALKDENGKVKKPTGWTAPNLMPYII